MKENFSLCRKYINCIECPRFKKCEDELEEYQFKENKKKPKKEKEYIYIPFKRWDQKNYK